MKFSIVTPNYNTAEYLEETINSVISQDGPFEIEYIVMDGGSTDNSKRIIEKYAKKLKSSDRISFDYYVKRDKGMYDAICNGFAKSTGEIMAWINADDKYQKGAFNKINDAFKNRKILWIKGITDYILEGGYIGKGRRYKYSRKLIQKGVYGILGPFIQQDSVFWRRELWNHVDSKEIASYKLAGDFRLWQLFSQYSRLVSINEHISYFRKHENQKSLQIEKYLREARKTVNITNWENVLYNSIFKLRKWFV